ncbi:MAG TPA: amidohydrolase family protein, partial [Polyangiaceae bacterium]|nr:amidohydrolase family protein [Polyangiaceae bacterium]
MTLFQNVKVFDGRSGQLTAPTSVLVVGNAIDQIRRDITAPEKALVIDAGGRTLMPGLIDAHWHAMLVRPTAAEALSWDVGYTNLVAAAEATDTLLRGFTTVRDLGGPVFGLARAIDQGVVTGPRIYPSG